MENKQYVVVESTDDGTLEVFGPFNIEAAKVRLNLIAGEQINSDNEDDEDFMVCITDDGMSASSYDWRAEIMELNP